MAELVGLAEGVEALVRDGDAVALEGFFDIVLRGPDETPMEEEL